MAKPKVLSASDMKTGAGLKKLDSASNRKPFTGNLQEINPKTGKPYKTVNTTNKPSTTKTNTKTQLQNSFVNNVYGNFANPDFAQPTVPTVELKPTNDVFSYLSGEKKKEKKKTKTQKRLEGTLLDNPVSASANFLNPPKTKIDPKTNAPIIDIPRATGKGTQAPQRSAPKPSGFGLDTIDQMAKTNTQGWNFANPNFFESKAVTKLQSGAPYSFSPARPQTKGWSPKGPTKVTVQTTPKVPGVSILPGQTISKTFTIRDKAGNLSRSGLTNVVSALKQSPGGLTATKLTAALSGRSAASVAQGKATAAAGVKRASMRNLKANLSAMKNDPNLSRANAILRETGANYRIEVRSRRRRRGRYVATRVAVWTGPSTRRTKTRIIHNGRRVSYTTGNWPGKVVYGKNTNPESIVREYERNKAISNFGISEGITKKSGESFASHAARVTSVAKGKQSRVQKYLGVESSTDPDAFFGYTGVKESEIKDLGDYAKSLQDASESYAGNIDILKQAIGKVNVARGKASGARRTRDFLSTYDTIEAREKPFDTVIASTSAELAGVNEQINLNKNSVKIRNEIGRSVNDLMDRGLIAKKDKISVAEAIAAIDSKIDSAQAQADALVARPRARRRSGNRSAMRAAESQNRSMRIQENAARANVSALRSAKAKLEQHGVAVYGETGKINEGVIAKPGNLLIQGQGGGKRKWYRGVSGSTRINIGKDKVPVTGKVMVEATISYTSGYKGPTHADTSLGRVNKGTTKVRKEVPVDAQGNIIINSKMYGVNRPHHAKMSISNIKVIDQTKSAGAAQNFGNLEQLTAQKQTLQSTLSENQAVKNYFDNAQDFLTGKTSVLKDKAGNVAARYNGKTLTIQNEDTFKDVFGNVSTDVLTATRAVSKPLEQIKSKQAGASGQALVDLKAAEDFLAKGTKELKIGGKVVAKRGQLGKITVVDKGEFGKLGVGLPSELVAQKTASSKASLFSTLEADVKAKEASQKALVAELKTVQKERIKENAAAQAKQINELVKARVLSRRDATKQKAEIAKIVATETKKIDTVDDNLPIPDIEAFDDDLKGEAQKILESTKGVIKGTKKANARAKLRQVTRSRKPQASPVGSVLKVGQTVPRPRPANPQVSRTTSLGGNMGKLRNPFEIQ